MSPLQRRALYIDAGLCWGGRAGTHLESFVSRARVYLSMVPRFALAIGSDVAWSCEAGETRFVFWKPLNHTEYTHPSVL